MTDLDAYLTSHTPAQIMSRRAKAIADLAQSRRQEIVDRYGQGQSVRAIAAEFGISEGTVSRFVIAAGVPRRPRGRPKLFGVVGPRAHEAASGAQTGEGQSDANGKAATL